MKYVYPAIFTAETNGQFSVTFPDLEGCYTGGDNLADAIDMAQDALCLYLYTKEQANQRFPPASETDLIPLKKGETIHLIPCDTSTYLHA